MATPVRKRPGPPESVECLEDEPETKKPRSDDDEKQPNEDPSSNQVVLAGVAAKTPEPEVESQPTKEAVPQADIRLGGLTLRQALRFKPGSLATINLPPPRFYGTPLGTVVCCCI